MTLGQAVVMYAFIAFLAIPFSAAFIGDREEDDRHAVQQLLFVVIAWPLALVIALVRGAKEFWRG